jgi:4'-phosphopantetheinyl transferase
MDVYWMEQTEANLPLGNDWLSAGERLRLDGMRVAKRHADWRLGRWTAKRALAAHLNLPDSPTRLADIEIRPAQSGAPEAFIANEPAEAVISLSHRAGVAACAVTLGGTELGCDLEVVEPRSDAFIADYFAPVEQALIEGKSPAQRFLLVALLWSAKESALKALRIGLRLDTRGVIVRPIFPLPESDGCEKWQSLQVVCEGGQVFDGWWRNTGNLMRTVVASPSPARPIFLQENVVFRPLAS